MKHLNIVVAVPIEGDLLAPLHSWGKRFDWSQVNEVHFIHIVKKNITPLEFGLKETPDANTYREMVPTMQRFLKDEAAKILPPHFDGKISFHLEPDFSPEERVTDMIKAYGATLIVVATRGKHGFPGLFHRSFTDHMVKFSPCDVFVVRPEESSRGAA